MTAKAPPVDWDRHAQLVARSIAGIDRSRLPGSKTQFTAIIHEAIVDAMMMAVEQTVEGTLAQINALIERGTIDEPKHSERNGIVLAYNAVHQAVWGKPGGSSIEGILDSRIPGGLMQAFPAKSHDQKGIEAAVGTADKPGPGKPEAALAELDDMRDALAEFRKHRRDTYPHEAISILLSAFDDMLVISEAAVREAALCAKTQTGEVA